MTENKNAVVLTKKAPLELQRDQLKLKAADKAVDAVADVLSLLVKFGQVQADSLAIDDELRRQRELAWTNIQTLDAETRNEIDKMAAALRSEQESTKRLQLLLDVVATKGSDLPDAIARGIGAAIENCTKSA